MYKLCLLDSDHFSLEGQLWASDSYYALENSVKVTLKSTGAFGIFYWGAKTKVPKSFQFLSSQSCMYMWSERATFDVGMERKIFHPIQFKFRNELIHRPILNYGYTQGQQWQIL